MRLTGFFDMGFFPDLRKILRKLVTPEERRTMLFSATLNTRVLNLAWDQMNEYEEIKIEPENITVQEITQEIYHVAGYEKFKLLLGILKKENFENAMIFCNTKHMVAEVSKRLTVNGFKTKYLMGDLPQKKRLAVINDMKAGKLEILVATDVAARGLHVDNLSIVINYDLPEDYENYVHRIGRTARAGKSGKAVSLACEKYVYHLQAIESFIGDKITVMIADDELFEEDKSEGMKFRNDYDNEKPRRRDYKDGQARYKKDNRNRERRRKNSNVERGSQKYNTRNKSSNYKKKNRAGQKFSKPVIPKNIKRPKNDSTMEERLKYYKAKYGEDFKPTQEMLKVNASNDKKRKVQERQETVVVKQEKAEKKGFFNRLFGKK